jgi:hypothetical protein
VAVQLAVAAQVLSQRSGISCANSLTDQGPALGEVGTGASHLEVIHIHDEEELQLLMPETRSPVGDGSEALTAEVLLTMLLPIPPGVGMPIKGQDERAHRVAHPFPGTRPPVAGKAHPRRGIAAQLRLDVGLLSVALLALMAREQSERVAGFGGLQGGRRAAHFLKDGGIKAFILHIVPLEHDSPFEFALRVAHWEL